ncbi:hypothetical protein KCU61_g43, partial [Aureobasidium melanogenum]
MHFSSTHLANRTVGVSTTRMNISATQISARRSPSKHNQYTAAYVQRKKESMSRAWPSQERFRQAFVVALQDICQPERRRYTVLKNRFCGGQRLSAEVEFGKKEARIKENHFPTIFLMTPDDECNQGEDPHNRPPSFGATLHRTPPTVLGERLSRLRQSKVLPTLVPHKLDRLVRKGVTGDNVKDRHHGGSGIDESNEWELEELAVLIRLASATPDRLT